MTPICRSRRASPGVPDNPVCVSCDRSGALPRVQRVSSRPPAASGERPRALRSARCPTTASYVFFDSADPLVPQATNHTLDVYRVGGAGRVWLPARAARHGWVGRELPR